MDRTQLRTSTHTHMQCSRVKGYNNKTNRSDGCDPPSPKCPTRAWIPDIIIVRISLFELISQIKNIFCPIQSLIYTLNQFHSSLIISITKHVHNPPCPVQVGHPPFCFLFFFLISIIPFFRFHPFPLSRFLLLCSTLTFSFLPSLRQPYHNLSLSLSFLSNHSGSKRKGNGAMNEQKKQQQNANKNSVVEEFRSPSTEVEKTLSPSFLPRYLYLYFLFSSNHRPYLARPDLFFSRAQHR